MSSADIAACFPSEHDSLLGTDVESRRRSSKPFYLTRSSLETRKKEQGGLAGWWARFGEGGTIFDAFLMNWVFILIILVLGLGMGGWASIKTMDEKVKEFELFDRCNGC